MVQASPEEAAPRFLLRDRDKVYGERFQRVIDGLGIGEVVTAARSPWQNPYAERLIGSLRRDCLDHVIVLDEVHLRRARYFGYYNGSRCHLSLDGDAPEPRTAQRPELGRVVVFPEVGRTPPSIRANGGVIGEHAITRVCGWNSRQPQRRGRDPAAPFALDQRRNVSAVQVY